MDGIKDKIKKNRRRKKKKNGAVLYIVESHRQYSNDPPKIGRVWWRENKEQATEGARDSTGI